MFSSMRSNYLNDDTIKELRILKKENRMMYLFNTNLQEEIKLIYSQNKDLAIKFRNLQDDLKINRIFYPLNSIENIKEHYLKKEIIDFFVRYAISECQSASK